MYLCVYVFMCICTRVYVNACLCANTLFSNTVGANKSVHIPAEVCLNFSLFFFLHFQGFSSRPRVANLLRRRMGGLWAPGTSDSERMAASLSTSSDVGQDNAEYKKNGRVKGRGLSGKLVCTVQACVPLALCGEIHRRENRPTYQTALCMTCSQSKQ